VLQVTRWHWLAVTAFWLFISLMYTAQILWMAQIPGERVNVRAAVAWQASYYAVWIPVTLLVWRVSGPWLAEGNRRWTRLLLHVPLFAVAWAAIALIVSSVAPWLAGQREAFWPTYWIQLRGRAHLMVLIYTAVAGTGAALLLFQRYQHRAAAHAALQAELAAARLQALRSHLEPHFLFNSLHSIAALARSNDMAAVVRLTAGLSEILRHVLDVGDKPSRLGDEFAVVERYLDIQRARFADRLDVGLSLSPDAANARVPLLVVQPLVENALKHGLAPRVQPGTLRVSAWRNDGHTHIAVEDDGVGLPAGWTLGSSPGTGLRNLSARLTAEFGDRATLRVEPRSGGGVRATMVLPYVQA
jgi:two-component system, LytTR family, sensor kinase